MSEIDRAMWNRRYQEGLPSLAEPDPFFVSAYERLVDQAFPNAGTALDLAAGLGRHALWLAERAWQVSAVDVAEVAIGKLSQTAAQLKVNIKLLAIDAAEYDFGTARFDLIILFYHLDRTLFPKIVGALNPGGLFICKMATRWGSEIALPGGNFKPLGKNELASLVPGLQAVDCQERPVRARGVVEFLGKKPPLPRLTD
jgi:SAM-dependent methyltransferase